MQNDNLGTCAATLCVQSTFHQPLYRRARRLRLALAGIGALVLLTSCMQQTDSQPAQGKTMNDSKKEVAYFDVALHSYLDRPIFDVYLNGTDIGVAAGQPHRGAGGLMTGVAVPLGPQKVTWRDAGTGDTFTAKNQPILTASEPKNGYLGVHIYPNNTVEVIPQPYWPEKTAKGLEINRQWELRHGK